MRRILKSFNILLTIVRFTVVKVRQIYKKGKQCSTRGEDTIDM